MDCLEYRRAVTSEPAHPGEDIAMHRADCSACARYSLGLHDLDEMIRRAMAVPVPAGIATGLKRTRPAVQPRWLALAASLVLAVGAGFAAWQFSAGDLLRDDLMAHIYHESDLLLLTADVVESPDAVNAVLQLAKVSLNRDIGDVAHAGLCYFRGNLVAHLIVAGVNGPVTVLLLPDEHVNKPTPIHEEGFEGTIIPLERGAIAVIGTQNEDTRPVETTFSQAVQWRI